MPRGEDMPEPACAILLGFTLLSVKHTIGDFFLQTSYQYLNKGVYAHPGGLLHAGIHAALTAPVFLVLPPPSAAFALAVLGGEFVIHYHVDWLKEQAVRRYALTQETAWYWRAMGLDQQAHMLTYIAIVALLAR